jgi:hypothetical protein
MLKLGGRLKTLELDDSSCPYHAALFQKVNKESNPPLAPTSLWKLPPCSLMKTSQVFTFIVRAIKNHLLLPSMTLKRGVHFLDKTPQGEKKLNELILRSANHRITSN